MFHSKFSSGNRNSFMEFHGWFRNFRVFKNRLIFGDFGGTKISQKFSGIQNNFNFPSYSDFYGHVKFPKFHVSTFLLFTLGQGSRDSRDIKIVTSMSRDLPGVSVRSLLGWQVSNFWPKITIFDRNYETRKIIQIRTEF